MGLEGAELVMALEERIGLSLPEEEVCRALTPRMLVDLIYSKLQKADLEVCQSQRAFYLLRRAFMKVFGLERGEVSLDTSFRQWISPHREAEIWARIKMEISARAWPRLIRPVWLTQALRGGGFAVFGITVFMYHKWLPDYVSGTFFGLFLALVYAGIAQRLTLPWQVYIPKKYQRLRDLIPLVYSSENMSWTRPQVSALVKTVIQNQLGISEEAYDLDGSFRDDFGMD